MAYKISDMQSFCEGLAICLSRLWLRRLSASLLLTLVLASPVRAGEQTDYKLGVGDVISLVILEKPEVSGSYRIGPDGAFTVPGLGPVQVEGLTARELEQRIVGISAAMINSPSVAVQIAEFRPIYILGDVARPGKYSYIPGLNVLQAVSLAEGFYRRGGTNADFSEVLADIRAKQGFSAAMAELAAIKVRLARLLAEQKDQPGFTFGADEFPATQQEMIKSIVGEETATLELRAKALADQRTLLEEAISIRVKELQTYDERLASQNELLAQLAEELSQARDLQKKGLATTARLNDLIREELRLHGEVIQTRIQAQQVASAISADRQSLSYLENSRRVAIAEEIRATQDRIVQLKKQLEGERAVIEETSQLGLGVTHGPEPAYEYEIQRSSGEGQPLAGPADPVQPGDMLIVRRLPSLTGPDKTSSTK